SSVAPLRQVTTNGRAPAGPEGSYEIHMGSSEPSGPAGARPFVVTWRSGATLDEGDGAMNAAGTVVGTYLHGLFANAALRRALLVHLAARKGLVPDSRWGRRVAGEGYDRLADVVGGAIDRSLLARLLRI